MLKGQFLLNSLLTANEIRRTLSEDRAWESCCLFCLADIHQALFTTPANLMLDNLWTITDNTSLVLWLKQKPLLLKIWVTICRHFFFLPRTHKLLKSWPEMLITPSEKKKSHPTLDGIWQDNFLTVKRVKQILLEVSYVYKISYILPYVHECDLQQKQHMSNRYFFEVVNLNDLYFTLVHIFIAKVHL